MNPFVNVAHAMGTQGGGGGTEGTLMSMLPLILMFAIFYFLLIRPQQKRAKEHRAMLEALKKGDEVVTSGGMYGRVASIVEDVVTLEVAPNIKIRVQKGAIGQLKKGE